LLFSLRCVSFSLSLSLSVCLSVATISHWWLVYKKRGRWRCFCGFSGIIVGLLFDGP
jgi:hypothetical protein